MEIVEVIRVVMSEIKETAGPNAVVGSVVESGDSVIIPVSKFSFGFGVGGSDRDMKKRSGLGAGVGAKVEPVAFVVVTKGKAKLLPVKARESALMRLVDMIPDVIEMARGLFSRRGAEEVNPSARAVRESLQG